MAAAEAFLGMVLHAALPLAGVLVAVWLARGTRGRHPTLALRRAAVAIAVLVAPFALALLAFAIVPAFEPPLEPGVNNIDIGLTPGQFALLGPVALWLGFSAIPLIVAVALALLAGVRLLNRPAGG